MQTDQIPTSEAARIVGRSVKTFLTWHREGKIDHVAKLPGIRGAYLWDRSDVEGLAEGTGRVGAVS